LERLSIKHGLWRTVCYSVNVITIFWSDCREEYAELVAEDKFRAVFDLLDYYQNQVSSEKSIIGGKLNKQDDNVFSTHAGRVFFVLSILMFVVLLFIDL